MFKRLDGTVIVGPQFCTINSISGVALYMYLTTP
jgi:hypothetical protein